MITLRCIHNRCFPDRGTLKFVNDFSGGFPRDRPGQGGFIPMSFPTLPVATAVATRQSATQPAAVDAISAELIGNQTARALGITVTSSSPVLALCRQLLEA